MIRIPTGKLSRSSELNTQQNITFGLWNKANQGRAPKTDYNSQEAPNN